MSLLCRKREFIKKIIMVPLLLSINAFNLNDNNITKDLSTKEIVNPIFEDSHNIDKEIIDNKELNYDDILIDQLFENNPGLEEIGFDWKIENKETMHYSSIEEQEVNYNFSEFENYLFDLVDDDWVVLNDNGLAESIIIPKDEETKELIALKDYIESIEYVEETETMSLRSGFNFTFHSSKWWHIRIYNGWTLNLPRWAVLSIANISSVIQENGSLSGITALLSTTVASAYVVPIAITVAIYIYWMEGVVTSRGSKLRCYSPPTLWVPVISGTIIASGW